MTDDRATPVEIETAATNLLAALERMAQRSYLSLNVRKAEDVLRDLLGTKEDGEGD